MEAHEADGKYEDVLPLYLLDALESMFGAEVGKHDWLSILSCRRYSRARCFAENPMDTQNSNKRNIDNDRVVKKTLRRSK